MVKGKDMIVIVVAIEVNLVTGKQGVGDRL